MKRKAEASNGPSKANKKRVTEAKRDPRTAFRSDIFAQPTIDSYITAYASSIPYKHGVISPLIDDSLLRAVRTEIRENVSFTPKETDIYRIHQSGDLANLDGLQDEALAKLPSLLALRDAMYSEEFRGFVSKVTGCGPLSGRKTDMAINVYTPGCYLLCHDDVIGSRRVSYILYLVDPDIPWKEEWGGALRLYPVIEQEEADQDGKRAKTPAPDHVKSISPAWNQLSFFAVQPGESFHDVEEVYHAATKRELEKQGGRVRMAISGWFHLPQEGEEGYVKGAEEAQARNSGLVQLQGNPDRYDQPQARPVAVEKTGGDEDDTFNEADLEFLLKYLAPTYLTPDTLESVAEHFEENSSVTIPQILNQKFATRLKEFIESIVKSKDNDTNRGWQVAKPPHKHRFEFLQPGAAGTKSPVSELVDDLLPSKHFRSWLQMATGCTIKSYDGLARRFRRGKDYTLATGHDGPACLEINLGITPTPGWGDDDDDDDSDEEDEDESTEQNGIARKNGSKPTKRKNGTAKATKSASATENKPEAADVGGHEVYMAGDEDDEEDAAIYKASQPDEDDNILFSQAAAWNKMTIVMRDSGTLRFVKYVNRKAKGDRWDVSGTFGIEDEDDSDEDEDEAGIEASNGRDALLDDDSEEEFKGFSDSDESSE